MAVSTYIGQSVKKVDNKQLVTGTAQFTSDIKLPGTLIGRILRSPHAHAKIKRIDVSKAKALPGVFDVLTGRDLEEQRLAVPFGKAGISDQRLLALDKVRYVGDEVAAVAAETEQIAEDALELIEVDYELLPVLTDPEEAM
ncbi:MAG: xanthine dehydrogenase family protein molybdopterin-binding subunit, partial [Chloroflexi bacterium]|nr:xanthine dehydrogenase family protein molybdopterin-binding subunit [Chloroflexota bacterium]